MVHTPGSHYQLTKGRSLISWQEIWPSWEPLPGSEKPRPGEGMSRLSAYEAGLTDDPGSWVQPVEVYWSPRLDPRSPDYDPEFVSQVAWEEPGPDQDGPELVTWVVSGSLRDLAVSVRPVNLLGVRVTASAVLNSAEHQPPRRPRPGRGHRSGASGPAAGPPGPVSAAGRSRMGRNVSRRDRHRGPRRRRVRGHPAAGAAPRRGRRDRPRVTGPGTTGRPGREPVRQLHTPMGPGPGTGHAGHRDPGSKAVRRRPAELGWTRAPASRAAHVDQRRRVTWLLAEKVYRRWLRQVI
jgi:hypothetical protein